MPDTNETDEILAKVRTGELSAGDAAALIASLRAASYQPKQNEQVPEPQYVSPEPQPASQPTVQQQSMQPQPVAETAEPVPSYQPQVPPVQMYTAPAPDPVVESVPEPEPQQMPQTVSYEPPAYIAPTPTPEPQPAYSQPSSSMDPYRNAAPDATATLPVQKTPAAQSDPAPTFHPSTSLPPEPPQETNKYIPVDEIEDSSFFTGSEPNPVEEKQQPKKKRQKPAKPSKPSRADRKAEKQREKEEARAEKAQKKAAARRGAATPNGPSLTGMEKIAVKVSRLQKVTAGLAALAVLAGGVAVVSQVDANNRIAEAFSGTTEVVAATKTIHAGDKISASDLAFVSVPNSTVADGAITKKDINDSSKTPVGRVASQYIAKGAQITSASTAGKDNPESLASAIGDGMEAVTISVDAQSGMGGMLRVNDKVKVIQPNDGSLGGDGFTVIADSVRIAALDGNFNSNSNSSDGYSTVTLEVTPEQAGKIRTAGNLTLTLPSSADTAESGE